MKTEICTSDIKYQRPVLVMEQGGKKTVKEVKQTIIRKKDKERENADSN